MELRKQAHAVYYTRYHVVVSTKYRRKVLRKAMGEYLKRKILQVGKFHPEIEIIEVNVDADHIHLLMAVPPKMAVSQAVGMIKANTGAAMRQRFPFLDKVYWGTEGIWSIGYFVSTVGIDEEVIRKYVEMQGKEDSGQAKLEL
jgi:putative transposase